ncbi:MAG: PLP-dependent aminotransferase family protein [Methylophilales bacterium]|nr:PLP-dependent aminotransferase family protein [Methylophilales bacterium]
MLRSWTLGLTINRDSGVAVYLQIAQGIIKEIQRGRLLPGSLLPSSRELAEQLGINRKTVILAYDELIAEGWLIAKHKKGTFVARSIAMIDALLKTVDVSVAQLDSPKRNGTADISKSQTCNDNVISFSEGVPDTRNIPFEALSRAFRHALITVARTNRYSEDPKGSLALREAKTAMLNMERGLNISVDNVCIVRGIQMGIFLAARILVKPGDSVVLESLSYPPAREAFRSCGADLLSVKVDAEGMDMEALASLCSQRRVRLVYVTPHHQFPTTVIMSADRRQKLLALAEQYDFTIIEDVYDFEIHFSHSPVLPLASMDRMGRVVHVGSLSKVLTPSLRVGYIAANSNFIDRCAAEIMVVDRLGNIVTELAVAELLNNGELKRHVRRMTKIYNERRLALAELVTKELSAFAAFDMPEGGLALWLHLSEQIDIEQLLHDMEKFQVSVLPGRLFSVDHQQVQAIRLGYGNLDISELATGVRRLRYALEQQGKRLN